jgi:Mycobacterium membrane protein
MNDQLWRKLRKRLRGRIVIPVVLLAIAGGIVLVGAISSGDDGSSSGSDMVSVLYEVEGTADSTTITLTTPDGGTSQLAERAVPLTLRDGTRGIPGHFPKGAFVYVSAQNMGPSGDITCRITVDGKVISENTASGGYTIATCQGST